MTETGLTGPLVSAWGSLYNIVQQTNKIINGIKGNSSNSEEVKNPYIAEARFMRGVAYSYLAMLWGNVIINEDTDELVANPIVNTSPVSDVYEFAMRDLEFAAKYLPEVSSAAGRVNKYSAFGMLSRVYLTYAGYSSNPNSATRNQDYLDLAKKAALKVIENRNFELMTDYADLFMIDKITTRKHCLLYNGLVMVRMGNVIRYRIILLVSRLLPVMTVHGAVMFCTTGRDLGV